jgi:hypothetical protein
MITNRNWVGVTARINAAYRTGVSERQGLAVGKQ